MSDSWRERLSEYIDGELEPAEAAALEAHLGECDTCRADLAGLRRVASRLDRAPDRQPPRDLWPELARRMAEQAAPVKEDRSRSGAPKANLRLAATLAGAALLGVLAWTWLDDRPGRGSRTVEAGERYEEVGVAWRELLAERTLPAELAGPLTAEMAAFERAVDEARRALAENPADGDLRAYLTRTLRAQARFMSRVEAWTGGRS